MTQLYFAFGSNLDERQMRIRCPSARAVACAWMNEHRIAFRGHSYSWGGGVATVDRHRGKRVPGVVYTLSDADMKSLDRYEGNAYQRQRVTVVARGNSDERFECWTYRQLGQRKAPPSVDYLAVIYCAYVDWGFSLRRLPRASTAVIVEAPRRRPRQRRRGPVLVRRPWVPAFDIPVETKPIRRNEKTKKLHEELRRQTGVMYF